MHHMHHRSRKTLTEQYIIRINDDDQAYDPIAKYCITCIPEVTNRALHAVEARVTPLRNCAQARDTCYGDVLRLQASYVVQECSHLLNG